MKDNRNNIGSGKKVNTYTTQTAGNKFDSEVKTKKAPEPKTKEERTPGINNSKLNSSVTIKATKQQLNQTLGEQSQLSVMMEGDSDQTVTMNMDENGFLVDKDGYPILGDDGNPIKLSDDNLDFFKENGLYEEQPFENNE